MNIYDVSNYTLDELIRAFDYVDDIKYPRRAETLYLRINELQSKKGIQTNTKQKSEPNRTRKGNSIGFVFQFIYYILLACFFRVNPLLVSFLENQEQETEDKIARVKDRLSRIIE